MTSFSLLDIISLIPVPRKNSQAAFPKCALQSDRSLGWPWCCMQRRLQVYDNLAAFGQPASILAWAFFVVDLGRSKSPSTEQVELRCQISPLPYPRHSYQAPFGMCIPLVLPVSSAFLHFHLGIKDATGQPQSPGRFSKGGVATGRWHLKSSKASPSLSG